MGSRHSCCSCALCVCVFALVRNVLVVNSFMVIDFYFPNLRVYKEDFSDGLKGGVGMALIWELLSLFLLV